jgi:hypothetical protein
MTSLIVIAVLVLIALSVAAWWRRPSFTLTVAAVAGWTVLLHFGWSWLLARVHDGWTWLTGA